MNRRTKAAFVLHYEYGRKAKRHSGGTVASLKSLLDRIARGTGPRLERTMHAEHTPAQIGHLAFGSLAQTRAVERLLNDESFAEERCELCHGEAALPIIGMQRAEERPQTLGIKAATKPRTPTVETPSADETEALEEVNAIWRQEKDALGFLTWGVLRGMLNAGRLRIARGATAKAKGYIAFTLASGAMQDKSLNIIQCCVDDGSRFEGAGKALVRTLQIERPNLKAVAKVREDLAANEFWTALGFELAGKARHPSSRKWVNTYTHKPWMETT